MNILHLFHCLWQSFIQFINFLGLKKRKSNKKLPKEGKKEIKERRLIVDLLFAQVYAIYYK